MILMTFETFSDVVGFTTRVGIVECFHKDQYDFVRLSEAKSDSKNTEYRGRECNEHR